MISIDAVADTLTELHDRLRTLDEGTVADYIPQLATVDRRLFGLALVSMDGHLYTAGDADVPCTIQSVSKPFVYALALADLGLAEVSRRVGAEPSGEAFNAISLEPGTGRPANPMVNAGAIVTTSLVAADSPEQRFERILACLSAFAGRPLDVDEQVFASEAATGDRNRALAHLMRGAGSLTGSVDDAVTTYFRQCAIRVTAADLAVMAATLANGGVNPVTGTAVVPEPIAMRVLAVMATCGMYDAAGDWLLRVGLPAKSGVSGALIAASPARFGIAVFSPPLDATGNPVRGVAVLREASERFGLHLMHHRPAAAPTVTSVGPGRSTRPRSRAAAALLAAAADRITVVAVQGALEFTETERLLHALDQAISAAVPSWVVLDLGRVTFIAPGAASMLDGLPMRLRDHGVTVVVVDVGGLLTASSRHWTGFAGLDAAVAWCEDQLLADQGPRVGSA
ncbi:glutaminase [Allocatelliglobosispora scoriae]|uniref:Glutaminase n=1 Tax=Allocatelliglobosispora scoriae TaxID=643052 RepID=A0A841BQ59_9ACTN|nr:glutaminase A [Allocatelliglobosispora scoriae]MBB5868960.1 glutaminase [Allocatelliglobosispora scoriae]